LLDISGFINIRALAKKSSKNMADSTIDLMQIRKITCIYIRGDQKNPRVSISISSVAIPILYALQIPKRKDYL
jgi:hypothetical protein